MNTTKHTPGPWRFSPGYSEVTTSQVPILESSKKIAECANPQKTSEEVEANGLLIAAAPDLLRALEVVVSNLETKTLEWGYVKKLATAAILKATTGARQ